ncbi:MAG TPA: hypothetical protein VL995_13485 [Cellvibrio sp.]|nr:hypothetical protein [Cellvibrio sp.]
MKLAGYKEITTGAGRPLFVRAEMHPLFMRVYKEYRSDYHMTSIMRVLMTLNADATRGKSLNPAGDERSITCGHISMSYSVFNGAILINLLVISKAVSIRHMQLLSVLYNKERKEWTANKDAITFLDKKSQWKSQDGSAHYAAVAGRFSGGVSDAAKHMPQHIIGAYEKAHYLTRHDKGSQYSLFWIEKGSHKSQEAAESLASIMQQSTKNQLPVNWLIHGDAIHTFKNSAKLINAAPLASAAAREKDATAGKAQQQHVFFSNPASSDSEKSLKALCEQAGLTFAGMNINNRDLRRFSTLKNVGRELGKTAAIAAASGTGVVTAANGLKTIGASGADKVIANGMDALLSGNFYTAAVCAIGVGVIAVGMRKNMKTIAAGIKCTFGKGNERWYTGDDALLS